MTTPWNYPIGPCMVCAQLGQPGVAWRAATDGIENGLNT